MTEVDRDAIDWLLIVVTVLSAVVGVIAIIVALRANRHAKDAEQRSKELVARERRRAFELEILRDLLDHLDDDKWVYEAALVPGIVATARWGARLGMLPAGDLPLWRAMADMTRMQLGDRIGATDEDYEPAKTRSGRPYLEPNEDFRTKLQRALRDDIRKAVERRMADVE